MKREIEQSRGKVKRAEERGKGITGKERRGEKTCQFGRNGGRIKSFKNVGDDKKKEAESRKKI